MTDWRKIVSRHGPVVWRTTYRLLGAHADAADCFQEAFIDALELSRRQSVRSWPALLQTLATRRALDALRKRIRRRNRETPVDLSAVPSRNPGPEAQMQAAELSDRLRQALTALPDKQAEVFCLRFLNDLSYRRIAEQLDLGRSAVGVLLHRARGSLREALSPAVSPASEEVSP